MAGRNAFLDQVMDRIVMPALAVILVIVVLKQHEVQQQKNQAAIKK